MKHRIIPVLILAVLFISGCGKEYGKELLTNENKNSSQNRNQTTEYSSLSELQNGKSFAVVTGAIEDGMIKEKYPSSKILYYQTEVDCSLAVANHKADAAAFDLPLMQYIAANTDGIGVMPEIFATDKYHFILAKTEQGERLQKEFNQWLALQKENGEIEKMYEFWCGKEEPNQPFDFDLLPEPKGKIRIVTDLSGRPASYYYNNSLAGFPIEIIYRFCRDAGYGAEITVMNFDSIIPALVTGKADIAVSFYSYTEERAQSVLFTDPYVEGGVGVLVRTVNSESRGSILDVFKSGLQKTFITEDRWKLILSGLGKTVLITLGGFLLANILGASLCACDLSGKKGLTVFADVYDQFMQGTPMVVILMILYYVILGKSGIPDVWVAIIAFGMVYGNSLAQLFYGAITGVDKGQTEAALTLGFSKPKAFMGIVFPQAAGMALTGYFSEMIGLMKGTSIIGYISIIDLTKAGDLIRSSTFDAFFPLLSVALIYFLLTFVILRLMRFVQKRLEPKRVLIQETKK